MDDCIERIFAEADAFSRMVAEATGAKEIGSGMSLDQDEASPSRDMQFQLKGGFMVYCTLSLNPRRVRGYCTLKSKDKGRLEAFNSVCKVWEDLDKEPSISILDEH